MRISPRFQRRFFVAIAAIMLLAAFCWKFFAPVSPPLSVSRNSTTNQLPPDSHANSPAELYQRHANEVARLISLDFENSAAKLPSDPKHTDEKNLWDTPASEEILLTAVDHFEHARQYLREGKFLETGRECEKALEKIPPGATAEEQASFYIQAIPLFLMISERSRAEALCRQGLVLCEQMEGTIPEVDETPMENTFETFQPHLELMLQFIDYLVRLGKIDEAMIRLQKLDSSIDRLLVANSAPVENGGSVRKVNELPFSKLLERRDGVLRNISKFQAWTKSLEEAWQSVESIVDSDIRDAALGDIIEMLIALDKQEDAEAWIEEIQEPVLRSRLLKKAFLHEKNKNETNIPPE